MNSNKQNLINKIKYRSHYRGTKEMDIFLSSFVDGIINDLNLNELEQLNNLVNLNDEEIISISKGSLKIDIDEKILNLLINFNNK
jgi:antitoxin CptB